MSSTMVSEDGCQVHYGDYVPHNVCNRWSVFCFVRVVPGDCCVIVWDCVHTTFQSFQNVTFTLQPVQWNGLWDESASCVLVPHRVPVSEHRLHLSLH